MFPSARAILAINNPLYKHFFASHQLSVAPDVLSDALEGFSCGAEKLSGAWEKLSAVFGSFSTVQEKFFRVWEKLSDSKEKLSRALEGFSIPSESYSGAMEKPEHTSLQSYPAALEIYLRHAMVAPQPPASGGASAKCSTKGVLARTLRTASRWTPTPLPWMMRTCRKPLL